MSRDCQLSLAICLCHAKIASVVTFGAVCGENVFLSACSECDECIQVSFWFYSKDWYGITLLFKLLSTANSESDDSWIILRENPCLLVLKGMCAFPFGSIQRNQRGWY